MGENYFQAQRDIGTIIEGWRIREDLGDMDSLIASVDVIGFVQPITITRSGALVSGQRRLHAARALGLRRVDVWVRTDVDSELELLLAEHQENVHAKPFTRTEQARFYERLKRIFAEDAAARQRATRFGASGAPDSGAPEAHGAGQLESAPGEAGKRAAIVVTGHRADYTLEHVLEVLHLLDDGSVSAGLRAAAADAKSRMDRTGKVEPHWAEVMTLRDTERLHVIAADPAVPSAMRGDAARQLAALPTTGTASAVRRAAAEALRRVTGERPAAGGASHVPDAVRVYTPRALVGMVDDLDAWWLHYDPVAVAETLSEEQWRRLSDWVDGATAFLREAQLHRRPAA
jgi:ParB family chromosome partitioning protein